MRAIFLFVGVTLVFGANASNSTAQQTVVGAPFHHAGSSFFENMGVGFGFHLRGGNLPPDDGGPSSVVGLSRFGVPGGNLVFGQNLGGRGGNGGQGGVAVHGSPGGFHLNFNFAQGSSRSFHSQTPSVTLMNGGTGSFRSGTLRPFVTSLIPVVGNWPGGHPSFVVRPQPMISPIEDRMRRLNESGSTLTLNTSVQEAPLAPSEEEHAALRLHAARGSTAGHGDVSVAAIHAQHAAEDAALEEEIAILIARGRGAEMEGKPNVARIYYQQAATRAEGDLREQLLQQIEKLDGS